MANSEERLRLIGNSILEQAEAQRQEWIGRANEYKDHELGRFEEELLEQMYARIQNEVARIGQLASERKARAAREAKRTLLQKREDIRKEIFAGVRGDLSAWTQTGEYRSATLDDLRALQSRYDHSGSVVHLREEDLSLADEVRAILGERCTVCADARIRIGGFLLENEAAGILVDETLDSRLEQAGSWFLENSHLRVQ